MRPLRKNPHRPAIEADVQAFLDAGGSIKQIEPVAGGIHVTPWRHTDIEGSRLLMPMAHICLSENITMSKLQLLTRSPGFPQPYLFKGKICYLRAAVREFMEVSPRGKP